MKGNKRASLPQKDCKLKSIIILGMIHLSYRIEERKNRSMRSTASSILDKIDDGTRLIKSIRH